METGTIFHIQKFCINDGPGIRTTVFFKGCPLHCVWCHNPESMRRPSEIFYSPEKCIGCRACAAACPNGCHGFSDGMHVFRREGCVACGTCCEACYAGSLEKKGYETTVEQIMAEVLKDKSFYDNSCGGITLSGGEPLFQADFAHALLANAKDYGLHTCVETCGYAEEAVYRRIHGLVDLFLFDYKETDPRRHRDYTGVSNEKILSNLRLLNELGCGLILRCPIIPGYNDRPDHFKGVATLANELKHLQEIQIEPYHPLGSEKAKMLGKEDLLPGQPFPTEAAVAGWIEAIARHTALPVKRA